MKEDVRFYVGQKAFICKGNETLILNDSLGNLDYPGGKVQEGETSLVESLKREVREETGLEIEVGIPFASWINTLPSHHKNAGEQVYLVGYRCDFVSGKVKLSNEHSAFLWVTKENYKELDGGSNNFEILNKYFTSVS